MDRGERRRALHRPHVLERRCAPSSGRAARACSGSRSGTPAASSRSAGATRPLHWDEALERGRALFALATDDSHHPGFDSGFAWTWVRAAERSQEAVLEALRRAVPSTARPAPTIHNVTVDEAAVTVRVQPGRERDALLGPRAAARARTPAGSATRTTPSARPRRRRARSPPSASSARTTCRTAGSRSPTPPDGRPGRTRCGPRRHAPSSSASRALRPARDRRRDRRRRHRGGRDARTGSRVALVDRGDFAGATSSASSKLIHGGLRYLRLGDVGLVREAHHERRQLMNVVAPHLVHRLPFLLPLYEDGPYRPWFVQSGIIALLDARPRAAERPRRRRARAADGAGAAAEGLRSCGALRGLLDERRRLTLANVRAAAERGGGRRQLRRGRRLRSSGAASRARGPRRRPDDRRAGAGRRQRERALARPRPPARGSRRASRRSGSARACTSLVDPARGLVGGADDPARQGARELRRPVGGDAPARDDRHAATRASRTTSPSRSDEVEQVLAEARRRGRPELGAASGSGVLRRAARAAGRRAAATASARRETVYTRGQGGMLSVAGGKLTTYRRIALDALAQLRSDLGLHRLDRRPWPLPGRRRARPHDAARSSSSPALRTHLRGLYGSLAAEVLAPARRRPERCSSRSRPARRTSPRRSSTRRHEWARSADDVLRRRTALALRGESRRALRRKVEELLARVRRPRGGRRTPSRTAITCRAPGPRPSCSARRATT